MVLKPAESESDPEIAQDLSPESSAANVQDLPLIVIQCGVPLVIHLHPDLMSSPDKLSSHLDHGPEVRTSCY